MCGIVAALGDVDIEPMLQRIAHRGPDGDGIVHDGDLHVGHVRLAIQDTSDAAAQPFTYGDVLLAYNGEMWNVEELRATLTDRDWRTSSDTEVLAALIEAHGVAALDMIDGMFALVWRQGDSVWASRDRWGKVPLYVLDQGHSILVASERKALPRSSRVRLLEPGVAVELATRSTRRWATPRPATDLDVDSIRTLLRRGVEQRLIGDRPVCFLLSGGLDSTLILHYAVELHPSPVAYTSVFDPASPDLHAARRVAAHYGVELIEVPVPQPNVERVVEAVEAVETSMPTQVEIALAHVSLSRAIAADGFRVALSGEAADELFYGYDWMKMEARKPKYINGHSQVLAFAVRRMAYGNFLRVNKVMMSAGVEARLPFMEENLVAAALASSPEINAPRKVALKEAARGVVPDWVISRRKETYQGATGIAAAARSLIADPVRFYAHEERRLFGGRDR
jgi:asparagine synthase (glutamine-hydrolysing)